MCSPHALLQQIRQFHSDLKHIVNGFWNPAETNRSSVLSTSASEMSTDESEHEDEEREQNEEDRPGCRGSLRKALPELPQTSECWESGAPPERSKPSPVSGRSQDLVSAENADVGKRRSQPELEGEASTRKRKSDSVAERTPKGQSKAKSRNTRSADWVPGGSPRKLEERAAGPGEERGASSSSSSDDEAAVLAQPHAEECERSRPKTKGSLSKKYSGIKEKTKSGRQAAFWEIPEKRPKMSGNAEERPAVRSKGQKDVWSSIQAQWPKKTLKELFSDSDTEAANSPPPVPSCLEEQSVEQDAGPEDEPSEEQMENDKLQEFPSSGSNSVLNTPPTTPESTSGGVSAVEDSSQAQPSSPAPSIPPTLPSEPVSDTLPPGPTQEEVAGGRSETDSSTVEVESLGGELQDLPQDEGAGSPSKVFDVSLSCNSSSSCSLELSSSSQQESEQKSKGTNDRKIYLKILSNDRIHYFSSGWSIKETHSDNSFHSLPIPSPSFCFFLCSVCEPEAAERITDRWSLKETQAKPQEPRCASQKE